MRAVRPPGRFASWLTPARHFQGVTVARVLVHASASPAREKSHAQQTVLYCHPSGRVGCSRGTARRAAPVQPDYPRIRAALHELREARAELKEVQGRVAGRVQRAGPRGHQRSDRVVADQSCHPGRGHVEGRGAQSRLLCQVQGPPPAPRGHPGPPPGAARLESNLANLREPKDRELRERASTTSTSPWDTSWYSFASVRNDVARILRMPSLVTSSHGTRTVPLLSHRSHRTAPGSPARG